MKRLMCLGILVLATLLLLSRSSAFAQSPKVPITYPGDTKETIARRIQWIEGAKKEGTFTLWAITRRPEAAEIIKAFNKVYPFIKVDFWRGEGEEIATKLEMEFAARKFRCDIAIGGEPDNFPRWRKQGLMQPFVEIIPGIKTWDKRNYSATRDSVIAGNNAVTPQYNTKLVSVAEAPKSWEDLLNPKWKGSLGIPLDPKTWWTMALAEGGWGVEKTIDFVTKLKAQNPVMIKGAGEARALMIAGDFKITTNNLLRLALLAQEEGAPVDWCRVSPIPITGPSLFMPTSGPHPHAARLFIEWFFSPEGIRIHEKITYYAPAYPGSGTRLSNLMEGRALAVRTEEVIIKAVETGLTERFNEILMR